MRRPAPTLWCRSCHSRRLLVWNELNRCSCGSLELIVRFRDSPGYVALIRLRQLKNALIGAKRAAWSALDPWAEPGRRRGTEGEERDPEDPCVRCGKASGRKGSSFNGRSFCVNCAQLQLGGFHANVRGGRRRERAPAPKVTLRDLEPKGGWAAAGGHRYEDTYREKMRARRPSRRADRAKAMESARWRREASAGVR